MDALVSAALEEVCARLSDGLLVVDLWPALSGAFQAAGLPPDLPVKRVLFARLIALPVINLEPDLRDKDEGVEEAERRGARLLASQGLRDNFLGLYDHRYSASRLSANQRNTLEHVGASRTSGVTQRTLCKRFGVEAKNFHYVVHSLQSQGLIVGNQAIEKSNDSGGESKVVSTNSLYLSRYAKQQVHDYIPAMKAICDKLEEASGKVLAVSDIKRDLGYKKQRGHSACTWRSVLHRLLDAQLVEEIGAQVDDEVVRCLRLLKKFSPNEFRPKSTTSNYKLGKKCLATDQFMELPLDNSIYDMIHDEGKEGVTLVELGRRLGGKYTNPKELDKRVSSMLEKFNLTKQTEVVDKTTQNRVWTSENFSLYKANTALQNCDALDDQDYCSKFSSSVPSKESDYLSPQGDAVVDAKLLWEEDCRDKPVLHHLLNNHEASVGVSQLVEQGNCYVFTFMD